MARTNLGLVQGILADNWQPSISLDPFIRGANLTISRVATCAAAEGYTLSSAELTEIETWYAAYLYTKADPLYSSKSTISASGSFLRDPKDYLLQAYAFDPSGCLQAIVEGQIVGGFWGGLSEPEQTTYADRN